MGAAAGPSLTIAIPFYSHVGYLRRALASLRAQTDGDFRALVCDDQGEAGAAEAVADARDPRGRSLANPGRLGMVGNWNRCLDEADTDLVTLLHADDELLPDYVRLMRAGAARFPEAAALFCGARVIDAEGRPARSVPDLVKRWITPRPAGDALHVAGEAGAAALLRANFIYCPTLCYRRARLGGRRFDPRWRFLTDLDLELGLVAAGETLVGLPEIAYAYRRHGASETAQQTQDLRRFDEERRFFAAQAEACAARGWPTAARAARRATIFKLNVAFCALQDVRRGRLAAARDKVAFLAGRPAPAARVEPRRACADDAARMPSTKDSAYTDRLDRLGGAWWKRLLDVQRPYRWNLRRLHLGRVLEVGCGLGRNLINLGPGAGVGIDHNEASVDKCVARGLTAYTPAGFRASPHARPGAFDALLLSHVAEHMRLDEARALIAEYLPYVRAGGQVVLVTPQEAGHASDPTHVEFMDFAKLGALTDALSLRRERAFSFPFPRPVGRVFKYNEFVVVARKP